MIRSVVDYYPVLVESGDPEPSLRELVYKYYWKNIDNQEKALEYAREYMKQIEAYEKEKANV